MKLQHSDISPMLEVARVAARLAGQRAMEEIKYVKTSVKNQSEMVTQADPICQALIINRVKETYPDHGFIAEEGPDGKLLYQPPRGSERIWWVIDPIDGTNNYAHGLLCFVVSIGVIYEGKPIVGVIFDPATDSMFATARDVDAQLNNSRIQVSDDGMNDLTSVSIDSHFPPEHAGAINEIIGRTRFRNLGAAALELAYVARGALIGSVLTVPKLWDLAAGAILVENAGGVVTDIHGGDIFPLDLDNYTGQQYPLLAGNKKTHAQLLELFNPRPEGT